MCILYAVTLGALLKDIVRNLYIAYSIPCCQNILTAITSFLFIVLIIFDCEYSIAYLKNRPDGNRLYEMYYFRCSRQQRCMQILHFFELIFIAIAFTLAVSDYSKLLAASTLESKAKLLKMSALFYVTSRLLSGWFRSILDLDNKIGYWLKIIRAFAVSSFILFLLYLILQQIIFLYLSFFQ